MAKGPRPTLRVIDRLAMLVAWLATCGIVYVLGYYVGQGTTERHAAIEERSVRLPVTSTPPPEGQRPKEKDFPSFYQALPAGERPIDVARGTPVTAPPGQPTPPARPTTTLAGQPATTPRPSPTSTTLVRTPPSTTPPRPTPTTTATSLPRLTTTTATSPPRLSPSTTLPTSAPPTTVPRTSARGSYTVEASPTRSRSEAESLLGTLRRRGYDATIVQVERDGDTWYRLRVGRYATSAEATDAMRRLRDVEGVTHVFVAAE